MAFEFFFGLFGLISSDSKSRHKSRLESEWRLSTPLNASLFREAGLKSPSFNSAAGSPINLKGSSGASSDLQRPIFSTTGVGTLGAASSQTASDGLFSSVSSSSASSVASSGSISTANSADAFIKPSEHHQTRKYEKFPTTGLGRGPKPGTAPTDDPTTVGSADPLDPVGAPSELHREREPSAAANQRGRRLRSFYCILVCVCLWLHVLRLLVGLLIERSLFTMDFFCLGAYRIHFLIPALCLAIQAAAVSLIFIRNNDETNWLVPFYSSKDYLIRSRSNFKPKIEEYTKRVNISVALALILALVSSISLSAYVIHCAGQSEFMAPGGKQSGAEPSSSSSSSSSASSNYIGGSSSSNNNNNNNNNQLQPQASQASGAKTINQATGADVTQMERSILAILLVSDVLWAIYSTYICFLVSFYFNLICSIMKSRFHGISKIIEDLAESNTTKTTNQARKITTLYLEHNEACELLDESNDFWQYLIFFTYFTYIPAYCYCLYNLFFVDFEAWPSFITWVIHTHTGFIILLISFSAAGVSTEAHAPYTSLHTLSLIQLPLDVEVNIATFLHRVRGLTIGYSCYDLFAITNASMSNTAAACASYFLIVADFSRSSVFTLAQMNGSASAAAATAAGGGAAPTSPAAPLG